MDLNIAFSARSTPRNSGVTEYEHCDKLESLCHDVIMSLCNSPDVALSVTHRENRCVEFSASISRFNALHFLNSIR